MNKADIIELIGYNNWAQDRLLSSLEPMKQEDFEKDLHSSHGGVRGTLFHMLNAENLWINRFAGEAVRVLNEMELKSPGDFKSEGDVLDKKLSGIVADMGEEALQSPFDYFDLRGNKHSDKRVWVLHHLVNHFTYHRGQIVAMQRQLGYTPKSTDLIGFYREKEK